MKKKTFPLFLAASAILAAPNLLRPLYEPPVLMYHRVGYPEEDPGLYVTPESFERQMEFLKAHHYRVWPLAELVRRIQAGETIPMNVVVITFDDGYLDNFNYAFPVLKKMDFPATIFMITDNIGKENWLTEEDLRILDGSGITIGSHTARHAFLPGLPLEEAQREIAGSKQTLEAVLGRPVTLFSYPAGGMTPKISQFVSEAGYEAAVTTNYSAPKSDPYAIRRIKVGDARGNLFSFWLKTSGFYHWGKKRVEAKKYGAP